MENNIRFFFLICFCCIGCASIPLGSEEWPVDDVNLPLYVKEEIEVVKFDGCHFEVFYKADDRSCAYCSLWADGEFCVTSADRYSIPKKMSFGFFPGMMPRHLVGSSFQTSNNGSERYIFDVLQMTLCSCLMFPLIDSIVFEPFSVYTDDMNYGNASIFSVFGFCKYWDTDDIEAVSPRYSKIVNHIQLDDYEVTFHGEETYPYRRPERKHNNSVWIVGGDLSSSRRITIEITEIGKYRGNISEFLKGYKGKMFELEY